MPKYGLAVVLPDVTEVFGSRTNSQLTWAVAGQSGPAHWNKPVNWMLLPGAGQPTVTSGALHKADTPGTFLVNGKNKAENVPQAQSPGQTTVTTTIQIEVLPASSMAVQVMVLGPACSKAGASLTKVTEESQLSNAVGATG